MSRGGGTWSIERVAGHACHVYEPPQVGEHGYAVLYLHGVHLGKLEDNPAFVEQFDRFGLRVFAPLTQRSWWTDRICAEFDPEVSAERHVIDRVLPAIESRWGGPEPCVALLGTSMGGQGALRLAFKYPDTFPIVAAISPAIDYHTRFDEGDETIPQMYEDEEEARQDTALLHMHALNWPRNIFFACDPTDHRWFDSAQKLQMKLGALGIPYECEMDLEAGGHGFRYYSAVARQAVEFLVERLDHERLRVV